MLVGMKIKGPIVTLGAVAAVGAGLFLVNVSQQPTAAVPQQPAAATATATAPTASRPPSVAPTTPAAAPFGPREGFVADIPTESGNLSLAIRVTGETARAYACDNYGIETWLAGRSTGGVVELTSIDQSAHLQGRHQGNAIVGKLTIGEKNWDFTAVAGEADVF